MSKRGRLTGEAAVKKAYEAVNKKQLLATLGVELNDEYLCLALTHRSFANENGMLPTNERLEFIGDSVFGLAVATKLFQLYPNVPESTLSKMKATVVSGYSLAQAARRMSLGSFVFLGRGEKQTGGENKTSILADTLEALIGAVYLQHGWEVANELVLRLFGEKIRTVTDKARTIDSKTNLQELLGALKMPTAEYRATQTGPVHNPTFYAKVFVGGVEYGHGKGHNKKAAEQKAALMAYTTLKEKSF